MNTTQVNEKSMVDIRYAVAGWLAIASACIFLPAFVLSFLHDIGKIPGLVPFIVLLGGLQTAFSVYAIYQFRNLLNEHYNFHEVDNLIMILIIANIAITCVATLGRIFPGYTIPAVITMVSLAVSMAIIGIMFSIRLLRLLKSNATLHGLLKPLAYLNIAGCICVLTLIGAPIGLIIFAVCDAILGVIFLKGKEEVKIEFV